MEVCLRSMNLSKWRFVWRNSVSNWSIFNGVYSRKISMSGSLLAKTDNVDGEGQALRFGTIFDKKPARIVLEEGKLYSWCTCGLSKKQPFCDNSHRAFNEANPDESLPVFKSHKFQVDKHKEYALCNCKQTKNRPFCDGTHKQKFVQEAVLT